MCECLHVCMCTMYVMVQCPIRPEEGIGALELELAEVMLLPNRGPCACRTYQAISPRFSSSSFFLMFIYLFVCMCVYRGHEEVSSSFHYRSLNSGY